MCRGFLYLVAVMDWSTQGSGLAHLGIPHYALKTKTGPRLMEPFRGPATKNVPAAMDAA